MTTSTVSTCLPVTRAPCQRCVCRGRSAPCAGGSRASTIRRRRRTWCAEKGRRSGVPAQLRGGVQRYGAPRPGRDRGSHGRVVQCFIEEWSLAKSRLKVMSPPSPPVVKAVAALTGVGGVTAGGVAAGGVAAGAVAAFATVDVTPGWLATAGAGCSADAAVRGVRLVGVSAVAVGADDCGVADSPGVTGASTASTTGAIAAGVAFATVTALATGATSPPAPPSPRPTPRPSPASSPRSKSASRERQHAATPPSWCEQAADAEACAPSPSPRQPAPLVSLLARLPVIFRHATG